MTDSEPINGLGNKHCIDLPVQESFDEINPNYMTTIIWEPIEHFLHNPERTLGENQYFRDPKELKKVNWPAIKVAWQNLLYRRYFVEREGPSAYTVYLGEEGWTTEPKVVKRDYGPPEKPEKYNESRASDLEAVKEDYEWVRNELIEKVGEFNSHKPKFGMPEDLFD